MLTWPREGARQQPHSQLQLPDRLRQPTTMGCRNGYFLREDNQDVWCCPKDLKPVCHRDPRSQDYKGNHETVERNIQSSESITNVGFIAMGSEETNEIEGEGDNNQTHWGHWVTAGLMGLVSLAILYYCIRRCTYHRKKAWARQRANLEEGLARALEPRTRTQAPTVTFPVQQYTPQMLPMITQHPIQTFPSATIDEVDRMVVPRKVATVQPMPTQLKFPGKSLQELANIISE